MEVLLLLLYSGEREKRNGDYYDRSSFLYWLFLSTWEHPLASDRKMTFVTWLKFFWTGNHFSRSILDCITHQKVPKLQTFFLTSWSYSDIFRQRNDNIILLNKCLWLVGYLRRFSQFSKTLLRSCFFPFVIQTYQQFCLILEVIAPDSCRLRTILKPLEYWKEFVQIYSNYIT